MQAWKPGELVIDPESDLYKATGKILFYDFNRFRIDKMVARDKANLLINEMILASKDTKTQ